MHSRMRWSTQVCTVATSGHVTPFAGVLSAAERAAVYLEFQRDEMQR